ncbi:nucleoporin protein Ndc1-Nup [Polychytrium aggregatum]|uniref:nucleoporin protein Ndc1-Nup n=1 Tax=Polychytrium aggregatum TaxID=110093 RepID=UPI0022FEB3DB|nr:nucleoporin protein Ndc1-Nup [Polychytrium aggregatum]KAI9209604.1 nucleoporin protein Ndc1-Nup [Polychytrium aggregatum]
MPDSVNKLVDGLTLRKASTAKAFAFLELLSIARYDKTRKSCIYTEQQLDDHRSVWEIVLSSSLEVINDLSTRVEKSAETSKSSTTATAKAATSLQSRSTGFQRPTAYPRLHNPSPSKVQAFVDKLGKLVYRSDDELRGYDDNVLEPLNVLQPDAKRPARDGDLVGSGAQPPSLGQGERHPSLRHRLRPEDPVNGGISSKPITATGPAEPIQRRIVSRLAGGEQLPSAQPPKARVVDQGAVPRLEDAQTLWQMIDAISVVILKRAEGTILGNWKASLKEAAMFSKIQIYIWSIQALSTLCIMSVGLDTHGYVQNSVPQVIESLLRCIDALEKIRSVKAYRLIGGVSTLATFFEFFGYKQNRDCEILLDVLKNSVYQITSKFYDRFNDDQYFQFSAKYADRLQQFLDFDA